MLNQLGPGKGWPQFVRIRGLGGEAWGEGG